jgi:hypothetical protein
VDSPVVCRLRETEDSMCIILVLLRRADGVNSNLNVRNYTMPSQDIKNSKHELKSKNGQNTKMKTTDCATQTQLNTGEEFVCYNMVGSGCSY